MSDKTPVFEIDGREYEWPGIVALSTRECRIWYEELGFTWESIWLENMSVHDLFQREGFLSAMARIAYVREHPEVVDDEVRATIDRQPRMSLFSTALQALKKDDEPSEDPKAPGGGGPTSSSPMRSEPESKLNGATSRPESSGSGSTTSSDQPDDSPDAIGIGESDTPSMSPPLRQVI